MDCPAASRDGHLLRGGAVIGPILHQLLSLFQQVPTAVSRLYLLSMV